MKTTPAFKKLSYFLVSILISGCAGTGERVGTEKETRLLDNLRAGMSMKEVINILGEPTTYTEIRITKHSETYYELTYINSVVNPGVVELYFYPGLVEIRLNTRLYWFLSPE